MQCPLCNNRVYVRNLPQFKSNSLLAFSLTSLCTKVFLYQGCHTFLPLAYVQLHPPPDKRKMERRVGGCGYTFSCSLSVFMLGRQCMAVLEHIWQQKHNLAIYFTGLKYDCFQTLINHSCIVLRRAHLMKQEFQGLGGQIHTNNSLCFVTASLEFVPLVHMNVGIVYLIHVGTSFKETTLQLWAYSAAFLPFTYYTYLPPPPV